MRFQIPYAITFVETDGARPDIHMITSRQSINTPMWYRASCVFLHIQGLDFFCKKSRRGISGEPLKTEIGQIIAAVIPSAHTFEYRHHAQTLVRFPTDDDWWIFQTYCAERDLLNAW